MTYAERAVTYFLAGYNCAQATFLPFAEDLGLEADFALRHGAQAIVRGVRSAADFDVEYQLAQINRGIHPELDTVLLPASPAYQHFSSSMVREMIRYHQPLEPYLPAAVIPLIQKMMEEKESESHGKQ